MRTKIDFLVSMDERKIFIHITDNNKPDQEGELMMYQDPSFLEMDDVEFLDAVDNFKQEASSKLNAFSTKLH